jgi:mannose-6-phosphate isomerase-like protein (cupin superfamily)
MADKVNLADKLATFSDHWAPRIVARYNDNEVRLVKVEGEFMWHQHDETDELFLVLEGQLDIELRERTIELRPGELFVVPRGTEHRPCARQGEVKMLLMDPRDLPNTAMRRRPREPSRFREETHVQSCDAGLQRPRTVEEVL